MKKYNCYTHNLIWLSENDRCPICNKKGHFRKEQNLIQNKLISQLEENIKIISRLTIENEDIIQLLPFDVFFKRKRKMYGRNWG